MKLKLYIFFLLVGFVTSVPMPELVYEDKGDTSAPQIVEPSYSPEPSPQIVDTPSYSPEPSPQIVDTPSYSPEPSPQIVDTPSYSPEPSPQIVDTPSYSPEPSPQIVDTPSYSPEPSPQIVDTPSYSPEPSPQIVDAPSYSPEPSPQQDYVAASPVNDYAESSAHSSSDPLPPVYTPAAYPTTDPTVYTAPPPYEGQNVTYLYPKETRSYNEEEPEIEERAHSVHSTYKKEQPHEFERPIEPMEVEVFDPYSFAASGGSGTTDAPYVSEEEIYVVQSPAEDKKQTPYPEEEKVEEPYPQEAYPNPPSQTNYDQKEVFDGLSSESEVYPAPPQQPSAYISEEKIYSPPAKKPSTYISEEIYSPPAKKPSAYISEEKIYSPPAKKPSTYISEEIYSPPAKKPSTYISEEIYSPPAKKPSTYISEEIIYSPPAKKPSTYISEEEIYSQPATKTDEESFSSSFLQAFDQILIASDRYRTSLTKPLHVLVEDASGRRGVVTCKLQRTRIVVTRGVKALLESYPHWVKLGTTIEESHCRQDSKMALVAYSSQLAKVAQDLAGMEDMDLDDILDAPNAAFKRLEQIVLQTLALFGPLTNLDDHHSHNNGHHEVYSPS
ncbi:Repetitive proline-rich cell wall protein [Folsomia candida]|uniref:Repetitive proline-rich cell wall protein n=2 Tax=Folsomia candida TaxID=158441 RepID=A0A226DEJ6_FOLCA|nr:Repetitive proline-rich cell wall protein [Folsomia candida]